MRLLATDLDGTLVFRHVVRQADTEALVRWRAAGNLLVLVTGHSVQLMQHAIEVARASTPIGLDYDYAVCVTGTAVIGVAGRVHRTRTLETDQVQVAMWAIGDVTQTPVSVFVSTPERGYVLDGPIGLSAGRRTPPDHFIAASLSQVAGLGMASMPLHIPNVRTSAALADGLEEAVDGIGCIRSTGFADITAAGESKGMDLDRFAELLVDQGMKTSEVATAGDSQNDVSMFEQADVPCTTAGAPGEVVEAAGGRTTPSMTAFIDALLARKHVEARPVRRRCLSSGCQAPTGSAHPHTSTESSESTQLRADSEDSAEVMAVVGASGGVASPDEKVAVEDPWGRVP